MRILLITLLLLVELTGCTVSLLDQEEMTKYPSEKTSENTTSEEELITFEKAQELFSAYQEDMEVILENFTLKFSYINIDVNSQGEMICTFAEKESIEDTIELNLENLSEYSI